MAKVVTFNNVVEFMEKGNKYYENLNCNIILRAPTQEEIKNINYKPKIKTKKLSTLTSMRLHT